MEEKKASWWSGQASPLLLTSTVTIVCNVAAANMVYHATTNLDLALAAFFALEGLAIRIQGAARFVVQAFKKE